VLEYGWEDDEVKQVQWVVGANLEVVDETILEVAEKWGVLVASGEVVECTARAECYKGVQMSLL